jgi:FkbM family methyltransferase
MQNSSFISNLKKGISARLSSFFKNPYRKVGLSWLQIKKLKHLSPGKIRRYRFLKKEIYFAAPAEFLHGVREIFIEELYKQELPGSPYIIDCGANIGLSVIYTKEHYPGARIIAFEPDEMNFKLLEDNIRSFGYSNIFLRKEAVWIDNTELQFAGLGSMSSKINDSSGVPTKTVKAIRLKDLLSEKVDFLKIDIEGAEYAVLKDIRDSLKNVQNLFVEYHGNFNQTGELTNMLTWINEQGFSYYIKEAAPVYVTPFLRRKRDVYEYDVQLNIFCFRTTTTGAPIT